jgi:multidrug transporter EmrE-like cation transporter
MSIWICIVLITLCAILWDAGVVMQKKGADRLPRMAWGKELPGIIIAFFKNGLWLGGLVVSAAGWGLFAFALNYTPVSMARTIQGSGFVILAFFSIFFLDHRLTLLEWVGVIIITAGIVALGLSEPPEARTPSTILFFRLLLLAGASVILLFLIYGMKKFINLGFKWVVIFSICAGVMLGLGDVSTKTVLNAAGKGDYLAAFGIYSPFLIASYLIGLMLLSRSYQHGRAILVTAVSDFCSRVISIMLGVYALGEVFPESPLLKGLRIGGLGAIVIGAAFMARFSGEQLAEELI